MSRLIDADALDFDFPMTDDFYALSRQIGIEMVKHRIMEASSIWKRCKDELPPAGLPVLCYSQNGMQFVGTREDEILIGSDKVFFKVPGLRGTGGRQATHWAYLDDGPKECNAELEET